jgi:hypothetical protein
MNTRTSLVALAALAALATTALSPTSAAAWGTGHFGESTMNNQGHGFGGASNPAVTHPDQHVPGATIGATGHGGSTGTPNTGSTSMPTPTQTSGGNPPANGQNGQGGWTPGMPGGNHPSNGGDGGWTPGSQGSHGPWSQGGHGPWSQGQMEHHQPCGYGGCGDVWNRWHRPSYGSVYAPAETYTAPVYAPPPVYTQAPVYTAPVQTTYAPAPQTYVQPTVQTYASAPPPAPCTCLTKSYAQDGSVLFADNCTKESAVAAPQQARY